MSDFPKTPLAEVAQCFKGPWSCEIKWNGRTIMLADDKHTEFGPEPLDEFFASRLAFLANESLNRWVPRCISEDDPLSHPGVMPKKD